MDASYIDDLRPGDLVGLAGCQLIDHLINLSTGALPGRGISQVAIVAHDRPRFRGVVRYEGKGPRNRQRGWVEQVIDPQSHPVLFESTCRYRYPCLITGLETDGIQAHPIRPRLLSLWQDGRVYHLPLASPLTAIEALTLSNWCRARLGTPYDYLGAFRMRDLALGIPQSIVLRKQLLQTAFCSEFCAAALRVVGRLDIDPATAWNPNSLTRRLERDGIVLPRRRLLPKGACP